MVPSSEIPSLIQSCDLLVHPSYREGLPRVVVQAMLAGVPVVATDADGTREVCVPEKQVDWSPSAMLKRCLRPPRPPRPSSLLSNNGPKKPKPWSVPSSPSMPWWMRWRRCMPSCWLEAVVLLFGQTFGLAAEDVRPTLTARRIRRCCVRLLKQSVNRWGTQTIGQVELSTRLASTDRGPSQSGGPRSCRRPVVCGPFACTASHLSWTRRLRRAILPSGCNLDRRTKPWPRGFGVSCPAQQVHKIFRSGHSDSPIGSGS